MPILIIIFCIGLFEGNQQFINLLTKYYAENVTKN